MNIYKKIFECKKEIGKISKDSTNPFFNSKYFDINSLLEHVEPILRDYGLLVLQPIIENKVRTEIIDVELNGTNGSIYSEMELTNLTDPQKRGSEITYYRRYTLQSLLSLQAEDDDANNASVKSSRVSADNLPTKWLNKKISRDSDDLTKEWINVVAGIDKGTVNSVTDIRKAYKVNKEVAMELELIFKNK